MQLPRYCAACGAAACESRNGGPPHISVPQVEDEAVLRGLIIRVHLHEQAEGGGRL